MLIISLGAKLKIGKCKVIREWFIANEFADFGDPVTDIFLSRRLPKGFVTDENVRQKVVEYFASFDEHIKDFKVEKIPDNGGLKESKFKINALHKMVGSNEMAEIPLGEESAGTLKMFALYPKLQEVLEKGSVFFIDELNAAFAKPFSELLHGVRVLQFGNLLHGANKHISCSFIQLNGIFNHLHINKNSSVVDFLVDVIFIPYRFWYWIEGEFVLNLKLNFYVSFVVGNK